MIAEHKKRSVEAEKPKFVSTGSTLLNLGLSDDPYGGFPVGKIANIIGDHSAGKTFILLTLFAEATYNPLFAEYDIFYDEPEQALEINIPKLFGDVVEERIIKKYISDTIEDFHDNVFEVLKKEKPFIYGEDSFDALTSEAELKRDIRDGSYKMEKAKISGEILRKIVGKINGTDSLLIIISQTRENIGVTFGSKKTRSGGKALHFYCTHELWTAVKGHIKRKERDVGVNIIVKISKNKFTGKLRTIEFPIYFDYGIDNIGSCIDWLIEEKHWIVQKRTINAQEFIDATKEKLIQYIEEEKLESKLIEIVAKKWRAIEESIATNRPGKYEKEKVE